MSKNNFRFYFYDFAYFWEFLERFLNFQGVWLPSQCDLDHFKSKEKNPILPIFEIFGRFFSRFTR